MEFEDIDSVIRYVKELPDFPNKALVLNRLETRNLNRYQEALLSLNETLASPEPPIAAPGASVATMDQLQTLAQRISALEANEPVAE